MSKSNKNIYCSDEINFGKTKFGYLNHLQNNFFKTTEKDGRLHLFYQKQNSKDGALDVGYYVTTLLQSKEPSSIPIQIKGKIFKVSKQSFDKFKHVFCFCNLQKNPLKILSLIYWNRH